MARRDLRVAALVVAAAVGVVHRPAVTTYCHAGRRCRGGRGQENKRCWADKTCRDQSLHPWNSTAASAPWEPIIGIGGPPRQALLGGPKAGLNNAKVAFKDGGEIARRFGAAASSVGAIVDTVVLADAAYYVGYAGLSTFDRTLFDVRATRDQWDARLARPDNCTF